MLAKRKQNQKKKRKEKTPENNNNNNPPKYQNKGKHTNNVKQFRIQQTKKNNTMVR